MLKRLFWGLTLLLMSGYSGATMAQDLLRIASPSISLAHGALAMAVVDSGIFENNGIELIIRDTRGNASECFRALLDLEVEICEASTFTGLDAIAEGAELQVVAALTGPVTEIVYSAKAVAELGIGERPGLQVRIDALAQARIATTAAGTTHYQSFDALLAAEGRTISSMTMLSYDSPQAMADALRRGDADAIVWTTGEMAALTADGTALPWISLTRGDIMAMERLPYVSAFARRDWVRSNASVVARLHKSYARANRLLRIDPSAAARVKAELAPEADPRDWHALFRIFRNAYLRGAATSKWNWQQMIDMRRAATGKDYDAARFERVVILAARK